VKPKKVHIKVSRGASISAGRVREIECESWGSVPAPRMTWLIDGEPLRLADTVVSGVTTSHSLSECEFAETRRSPFTTPFGRRSTTMYCIMYYYFACLPADDARPQLEHQCASFATNFARPWQGADVPSGKPTLPRWIRRGQGPHEHCM
jgi:hypothetical protein